ncbi:MAG: LacI family DNA-binding transcriptional regulator [Candidatus Atribacteria bacterium]|nr:LacI family DNA-binding transcriptional regulator [Candidatus Atribacteria bacterium]
MERNKRNGRVTIRDVAREAGVSQSTVSHFLNHTASLSPETKQRIREAIKKLHYRPHLVARNFKKRRTASLGLFIPDITNLFYAELSRGVADAAREKGYSVILYSTSYQREMEKSFIELVEQGQVDGVVVSYSLIEDSLWNRLFDCGVPLVLVDIYPFTSRYPSVVMDNEKGMEMAIDYLHGLGHTEIAYLGEPPYVLTLVKRQRSFLASMQKRGFSVKEKWVLVEERTQLNRVEIGFSLGKRLLQNQSLPTAVVASSDLVAIGAMKAFLSAGMKIPEDISVVGFDDILLASYFHPSLTTIRQPKYEMGKMGVEFLLRLVEGESAFQNAILEPLLVERNSCRRLQ